MALMDIHAPHEKDNLKILADAMIPYLAEIGSFMEDSPEKKEKDLLEKARKRSTRAADGTPMTISTVC